MLNPWRLRLLSWLDILGTVRAVADAANLSASPVSQQLAVLGAETHTQLLERTGRRVRLTPAGLMPARRARAITEVTQRGARQRAAVNLVLDTLRGLPVPADTRGTAT